jgi:hypothetical protein
MGIWYTTREDVASALDFQGIRSYSAARSAHRGRLARSGVAVASGVLPDSGDAIQGLAKQSGQRALDSAPRQGRNHHSHLSGSRRRDDRLQSDYNLEPVNSGPPYTRIEINLASSASLFQAGDTHGSGPSP